MVNSRRPSLCVTRTYVYDGEDILEERLSTGATIRYVHGPGIDQPLARVEAGTASYYLVDHLGSIVQTTDASATVTLTRQYDAWGDLLQGSAAAGYAFTGREWDPETGLYYYRARYYEPKIARFVREDPIGFEGGVNFYAYVHNRPTRFTDPLGLDIEVCYYADAAAGFGHVGFSVPGDPTTYGYYPTGNPMGSPGMVQPDDQKKKQCKIIQASPDQDECMKNCRHETQSSPGEYKLTSNQCTSFVSDCLMVCKLPAGSYKGPSPWLFYHRMKQK
jgi:RHS repeat-associated protein